MVWDLLGKYQWSIGPSLCLPNIHSLNEESQCTQSAGKQQSRRGIIPCIELRIGLQNLLLNWWGRPIRDFREEEITESLDRDEVKGKQNPAGEREHSSTGMSTGVLRDGNQLAPLWRVIVWSNGIHRQLPSEAHLRNCGIRGALLGVAASLLFPIQH